MADQVPDWISGNALGWVPAPSPGKIDTHHHFVPDFYAKAVEEAGGDPSGWPTPQWTLSSTKALMTRLGVRTAILSCTAPGPCALTGQASFTLARQLNEHAASLRDTNPSQFGFFAALPSLLDTSAALTELAYALDTLGADGVVLFTRYGEGHTYLGAPALEPIWAELDRRRAVVFVHPTHPVDTNLASKKMPLPVVDYPHETTRAAMDLIMSGTRRRYRECKVILSHAGGTLPYLISRVGTPLRKTPAQVAEGMFGTDHEGLLEDFRSFYFDLALSASPQVLELLLKVVPEEHILYGSDYPYAPPGAYAAFLEDYEGYQMEQSVREKINFGNAQSLFPRLAKLHAEKL